MPPARKYFFVKLDKYKTHRFICMRNGNVFLLKYCDSNITMFRPRLLTQSSNFSLTNENG